MSVLVNVETNLSCYHCGQPCEETRWFQDKSFCCQGCQTVFEILNENDLCEYYDLDKSHGVHLNEIDSETYAYLDEKSIRKKLLTFDSATFARIQFYIPAIHCVSCIWLLEKLQQLNSSILRSEVNFSKKTVTVDFNPTQLALSNVAALLASLGYAPAVNLDRESGLTITKQFADKALVLKLVGAGFAFGNVMLFSFPEYLGLDPHDDYLKPIFSWLNVALSIPVFFYSASDYMRAAWKSLIQKQINIDLPIAVGLIALFLRSTWEVATGFGPGYFDSFTGLVFFLLIGRWFQNKTYESLAFDRDFKSYFPLAVQKLMNEEWKPVVVYELETGDTIRIRNMEIVPADSMLLQGEAFVDYSFVTGESRPVKVKQGDLVYAGGKVIGQPIVLVVEKKTSQSHLTSLWNNEAFQKPTESKYRRLLDRAARRFTWVILFLSIGTAIFWYVYDASQVWLVITSVLVVACPCALALAAPFTYGSMLRVFGKHHLYLKNADVIERMAVIDSVVFDKTGTVTHGKNPEIEFVGDLPAQAKSWIKQLTSYSTHPMSVLINKSISTRYTNAISDFREIPGKGIEGTIEGVLVKIGSAEFVNGPSDKDAGTSQVFVSMNDQLFGYYKIKTSLRKNIKDMLGRLGDKCIALLSGDNETDKAQMRGAFHPSAQLLFNQSPQDKLQYIRNLQAGKKRVMMLGDGLNDSGALKQSDVGIAVTDDTGVFTPACDGILWGDQLQNLDVYLRLATSATTILKAGFVISFMYNAIALSFAVSGYLTPLVAAILMPISSISVVGFTTLAVNLIGSKILNGKSV
jgi:Cu+-exporting ATPase